MNAFEALSPQPAAGTQAPLALSSPANTLAELEPGASATIGSLEADSGLRLRMRALGLIPGRRVRVIRKAAFNGPLQVRSGHTDLLIRREEARHIGLTR